MNFEQLLILFRETHQELQKRAARSVDTSLVIRNWLFGWYIVEFEQGGATRTALYGKKLIERLSEELKSFELKGISPTSLKQCRVFYNAFKEIGQAVPAQSLSNIVSWQEIQQALPVKSHKTTIKLPQTLQALTSELANRFVLGWTHYVTRMCPQP